MILLTLALLFGIAVAIFVIATMIRARRKGGDPSMLVKVIKVLVLLEAIALVVVFAIVLVRTMTM